MDLLEEMIQALQSIHNKIWYFADGVYSMFGDRCPINDISNFLDRYPAFHAYIDDAHSMSILGKNGKGFALSNKPIHEKMVISSSMAKAFATGGGILVFPNKELAQKIRTCGAPFNSSGPLQPATLGAAVASAKIHLTTEIYQLQEELKKRIQYAHNLISQTTLPVISNYDSAIFFIGTSQLYLAYEIMEQMMEKGFLVNLGIFPAVSKNHSGIRFTITLLQTFEQIERMISVLNNVFTSTLIKNNYSVEQIKNAFSL